MRKIHSNDLVEKIHNEIREMSPTYEQDLGSYELKDVLMNNGKVIGELNLPVNVIIEKFNPRDNIPNDYRCTVWSNFNERNIENNFESIAKYCDSDDSTVATLDSHSEFWK